MPRKSTMRENVSAVRTRLPNLSNLSREKIELALLYYESNVDETVEAFQRNGAIEALSGWTEMSNNRGHNSNKRTNNKSNNNQDNKTVASSNGILRPSQRVSNIFQTFAEGGTPIINGKTAISNVDNDKPLNLNEQLNQTLETYSSTTDLSFNPCLSEDLTINDSQPIQTSNELNQDTFQDIIETVKSDEINLVTNHIDETNESIHRQIVNSSNNLTTSTNHEQSQTILSNENQSLKNHLLSTNSTTINNNRKLLTKSTKDLQRQTSTLTNVELSFENEIKSSIKRIDDVFKQIRDIIKEREIELYLEIDKVKEQGINIIHHRQQRATELRQRIDRCDRLEQNEIDYLRNDIKQFVTERRYELSEELTSTHRFQYDSSIVDALKNFGTVLRIDRKYDRTRTLSSASSAILENDNKSIENNILEKSIDNNQTSINDVKISIPNERNQRSKLSQRINKRQNFNENNNGDYYGSLTTNESFNYYDDSHNHQVMNNRRRPPQQQKYLQYSNENNRRSRPTPSNNTNNRRNGLNNSEIKTAYRYPQSSQTTASST